MESSTPNHFTLSSKPLGEFAQVIRGYSIPSKDRVQSGEYLLARGRNIVNGEIVTTDKDIYVNKIDDERFTRSILQEGDLVINLNFVPIKLGIYKKGSPCAVADSGLGIIRNKNNPYIKTFLLSETGKNIFLKKAGQQVKGEVIPHISIRDLVEIEIPLLPLDDLNQISEEQVRLGSKEQVESLRVNVGSLVEQLISTILLSKGWAFPDIRLRHRIGNLMSDICLYLDGKPIMLIEAKSGNRNYESAKTQLSLLCEKANVGLGVLITESSKLLFIKKNGSWVPLSSLPSPKEIREYL